MEAVLPRVGARTKRKRRKPMPPWLRFYLAMVIVDALWLGYNVFNVAIGKDSTLFLVYSAIWCAILARDWPRFKREWDAWRRDNGDE
jgi:hypothetical protein